MIVRYKKDGMISDCMEEFALLGDPRTVELTYPRSLEKKDDVGVALRQNGLGISGIMSPKQVVELKEFIDEVVMDLKKRGLVE